jgi:transposase-like protein
LRKCGQRDAAMFDELISPIFSDETAAREALEMFVWPNGVTCPHCGNSDPHRIKRARGTSPRAGVHYCGACKNQFTATLGTAFEGTHVPLTKWWRAIQLFSSSDKKMSARQLQGLLGVSYTTAWFMAHRIREAVALVDFRDEG